MKKWVLSATLAVCLFTSGTARAQGIAEGRELYFDADFEAAVEAFEAALEGRDITRREAATAHIYLGALRFMFDRLDEARSHVEAAVALEPDIEAPDGAPTELRDLVVDVRRDLGGPARLEIHTDGEMAPGRRVEVRATLDPAPFRLEVSISLECFSGEQSVADAHGPPPEVSTWLRFEEEGLRCSAEALTSTGAMLIRNTRELRAVREFATRSDSDESSNESNRRGLWIGLGVGAGVLVIAAIVLAVVFADDTASLQETIVNGEGW